MATGELIFWRVWAIWNHSAAVRWLPSFGRWLGPVLSAVGDVFDPSQPNPMLYDASRRVEMGRNSSKRVGRIEKKKMVQRGPLGGLLLQFYS